MVIRLFLLSALPQAAITITNDETNISTRLVTNSEGLFVAPSLQDGFALPRNPCKFNDLV